MKKRPALILLLSVIALFNGGCGQEEQNSSTSPSPAPVVGKTPAVPVPVPPSSQAAVPLVTSPTEPINIKLYGLIPSTNIKQRQQEIIAGRANPFSLISIQPQVTPVAATVIVLKKPITNKNNIKKTNSKSGDASGNKIAYIKKLGRSSQTPGQMMTPIPIPLPNPSDAKAVEILGVLQIGNQPFAIVQAPGESVPRYVGTGASLVNGQVQVKSINSNAESPTVTLEQYGQQVIRAVGQAPEKPSEKTPETPPTESQTSYLPKESGYLSRLSLNP